MEQIKTTSHSETKTINWTPIIFWVRFGLWIFVTTILPIIIFAVNFGLFKDSGYMVVTDELGNVIAKKTALNGWGITSIVLICLPLLDILTTFIDVIQLGTSDFRRILVGIKSKIIPLLIAFGLVIFLKDMLEKVQLTLMTIGITQFAGIFLNPLPQWKNRKIKTKSMKEYFLLSRNMKEDK